MYSSYINLAESTATLQSNLSAYCNDASSRNDTSKREDAQESFKQTMQALQYAIVHTAKGQGLEPGLDVSQGIEVLYSWPLSSACSIDKRLAAESDDPGSLVSRRGLDAMEYLLFISTDANSSCDVATLSETEGNQYNAFNALSADEKQLRRCNYMTNVMSDAVTVANAIKDDWDPAIGNYLATVKNSSDPLVTLNHISDAMYYPADVGKEDKLAQPMGSGRANTTPSCGEGTICPQDVESPNARVSIDNLISNIQSFQALFFGGPVANKTANIGFDDWLIAKNQSATAAQMESDIEDVLSGLEALKTEHGSLYTALTEGTQELETLFDGPYQSMTRAYRDDVLPALGLQPPQSSLADTD